MGSGALATSQPAAASTCASVSSPRQQLRELGLRPSKALGQHFLHDEGIVARIVAAAGIEPTATVLEIGPGLGVMTRRLAQCSGRVIAVEKDRRLADALTLTMPSNVEIVAADALEVDPGELAGPEYVVVANLPYSVGNAILRRLLEALPPPRVLTLMLQREVAERIAAQPPDMSILAVAVQFYGTPRILFRVGRGAFIPPPNVESAVIQIVTHIPPLPGDQHGAYFELVRAGFGQRRKQLVNALTSSLDVQRAEIERALHVAGLAPATRAEQLSVSDWVRLHQAIAAGVAG